MIKNRKNILIVIFIILGMYLVFDFDPEDEKQKEDLFKLKLKMFEQPHVDESKSRKLKSDIRKADTPLAAIQAYSKFKR